MIEIFAIYGLVNSKQQALDILGLSKDISKDIVNKAFKQKALLQHPDVGGSTEDMQLLIAARDFLLTLQEEKDNFQQKDEDISYEDDEDISYEDIAKLRKELGRDEFDRKYPGWTTELKHEMGLDYYNDLFEGYNPNDDIYSSERYERMLDQITEDANDLAQDIIDLSIDKNIFSLYLTLDEALKKLNINILDHTNKKDEKLFYEALEQSFNEKVLKNLDATKITLQDVLDYPNINVIHAFLNDIDSTKVIIPNELLENREFCRTMLLILANDPGIAKFYIKKYKDNIHFINGMMKCLGFLYYCRNNDKAKEIINMINFSDKDRSIVNTWLKAK